jgi:triacylglycerol esterase/lipase EstA (alpha/beta hydrolase family)
VFGGIEGLTVQLADRVEAICAATGAARVTLVGHSMGGLVARAYMRQHGAGRVAKIVALGTPQHGSLQACFMHGRSVRQMRPGSTWLEELNQDEQTPPPAPIVSVMSWHDDLVAPQYSALLANARTVSFAGLGHLAMGFSPRILEVLDSELGR